MHQLLRSTAATAVAAVVVTTLAPPALATPADSGAAWLQGEQSGDGLVRDSYQGQDGPVTYVDHGLTADFGFAFAALGQDAAATTVRDGLEGEVDSYTTGADFGAPDDVYAGPTAKLAALVQATGGDPRAYGGVNLVRRLSRLVATDRPITGRIEDTSTPDYANTIGQAFATRALGRAGSSHTARVTRFLLEQQCSSGYFRLDFAGKRKADQSCDAGSGDSRAPDTDATALAAMSLRALPRSYRTSATRAAVTDALDWLQRRQRTDGSLGGGVSTEGPNSNSTGLAAWVLGDAGRCAPARSAARWVRAVQVPDGATGALAGEDGAIGYDPATYRTAQDEGITDASDDQWRRTTAQAAPGLAYVQGC